MIFDPPFETTSLIYGTESETPGKSHDLDDWQGLVRGQRLIRVGAAPGWEYTLNYYAENIDLRMSFLRVNQPLASGVGWTLFQTIASTLTGDSEHITDTLSFTEATGSKLGLLANNPAWFVCYLEAKLPVAGIGYLYSWGIQETRVIGSQLPRG